MILVSGREEDFCQSVAAQLDEMGLPIQVAVCAREIRSFFQRATSSCIWVTESMIPDASLSALLQESKPGTVRVLLLTPPGISDAEVTRWLDQGVHDVLEKPFTRPSLLNKVRTLREQVGLERSLESQGLEWGPLVLNDLAMECKMGSEDLNLTPHEFRLLRVLVLHQGTVLSRAKIIEHVQGVGINVIDRAVDTHVAALRKKLGELGTRLETVRGIGYRLA